MRQAGRTAPAGDGKHRGSEIVIGVSCSGSGAKRWRTELALGWGKSLDDHHGAAKLGGWPSICRAFGFSTSMNRPPSPIVPFAESSRRRELPSLRTMFGLQHYAANIPYLC